MKTICLVLCILSSTIVLCSESAVAQEVSKISPKEIMPVVVAQEGCPVRIESFTIVLNPEKRYAPVYLVRNLSHKNIVSYRIALYYDNGNGYLAYGEMPPSRLLPGGQTIGNLQSMDSLKDVTSAVGPMKAIAFAMIVDVTFEDGSSYSAKELFNNFEKRLLAYRVE